MKIAASTCISATILFITLSSVSALPKKLRGLTIQEEQVDGPEQHRVLEDGFWGEDGNPVSNDPIKEEEEKEEEEIEETNREYDNLDIEFVAKEMGVIYYEAALVLKQQIDFSDLVAQLNKDPAFSQAEMPMTLDDAFVVMFKKGEMSRDSAEKIEDFMATNSNVQVKLVETKLSLEEAETRGERFASILKEFDAGQIGYSIDGDKIELMATMPHSDRDEKRKTGKLSAEQVAEMFGLDKESEDLEDISVIVEDESAELEADEHTYGGRRISGGGSQCTTGFTVRHNSGITGVATAAHCTGMNWYDGAPPDSGYSTSWRGEHNGNWGDFEWHTTSHIEPAEYYASPWHRWPVRSIAFSISKNEWVCGYSRMQGTRHCDRVLRTSVSQGGTRRLVAMRGENMVGGDSGGPWSWYDKAYGIHKGERTICTFWPFGCARRDTWSRVSYMPIGLGVTVRTQ